MVTGVTGHGVATTTTSTPSISSSEPSAGTPHVRRTHSARSSDRVTTPVQRNRSGISRAIRTKNSPRQPEPTTA